MQNQILNDISPAAVTPQTNYTDAINQIEQTVREDAQRLMLLQQQGLVTQNQAQYFINKLINTQNQINLLRQYIPQTTGSEVQTPASAEEKTNPFDLFNQEKPDFYPIHSSLSAVSGTIMRLKV